MVGAFLAFSMAAAYSSGDISGVKIGSVAVLQVSTYISSATSAGVGKSTMRKTCRRAGLP